MLQDFRGTTEVKLGYIKKDEKGEWLPAGNIVIHYYANPALAKKRFGIDLAEDEDHCKWSGDATLTKGDHKYYSLWAPQGIRGSGHVIIVHREGGDINAESLDRP